jgi:hypothetical protein
MTGLHDLPGRRRAALRSTTGARAGERPYATRHPVRNTPTGSSARQHRLGGERACEAAFRAGAWPAEARPATPFCVERPGRTPQRPVGQAWAIGPAEAAGPGAEPPRSRGGRSSSHPSTRAGLWRRVEATAPLGPDYMLNHQLWFAAAGRARLPLAAAGRPASPRSSMGSPAPCTATARRIAMRSTVAPRRPTSARAWRAISRRARGAREGGGYHAFNLHALALLRARHPDHAFASPLRARLAPMGLAGFGARGADNACPAQPGRDDGAGARGLRAGARGAAALARGQLAATGTPRLLLARATPDPTLRRALPGCPLPDLAHPDDAPCGAREAAGSPVESAWGAESRRAAENGEDRLRRSTSAPSGEARAAARRAVRGAPPARRRSLRCGDAGGRLIGTATRARRA